MNLGVSMYRFLKRTFDLFVAGLLLVLTWPLILLLYVLSWITMGNPVLYIQLRPGRGEKLFKMKKFRTMNFSCDAAGNLLTDNERLTWLGRLMRKTSLDELPQLWNVLTGEMSLVGPRPLLKEYLPHYSDLHRQRHNVRPGITGWAQVNGRNDLLFSERLDLDVYYVKNMSLWFDLKILLLTVLKTVSSSGVRSDQILADVDDLGLSRDLTDEAYAPDGMS